MIISSQSALSNEGSLNNITNDQLDLAIKELKDNPNDATQKTVFALLNQSTFLIATTGQSIRGKKDKNGVVESEAGSKASFIMTSDGSGNSYIPVFTSWSDLEAHNKRSAPIWEKSGQNAIAMSANDVWLYATDSKNNVFGVVINPSTMPLPLNKKIINALATK